MVLGVLDVLYQVLASPPTAFRVVSEKRPLGWAILTAIFSSVVFAYVILPNPHQLAETIFGLGKDTLNIAPLVLVWLSLFPLALLIQAGLLHAVAVLLRGRGSYLSIFCGVCFASFPVVFFAPLALFRAVLESGAGQLLYNLASLVLLLWILVLDVMAVRQNYHFPLRRAVATCLIPFFLVFVAPPLIVLISVAF